MNDTVWTWGEMTEYMHLNSQKHLLKSLHKNEEEKYDSEKSQYLLPL